MGSVRVVSLSLLERALPRGFPVLPHLDLAVGLERAIAVNSPMPTEYEYHSLPSWTVDDFVDSWLAPAAPTPRM